MEPRYLAVALHRTALAIVAYRFRNPEIGRFGDG